MSESCIEKHLNKPSPEHVADKRPMRSKRPKTLISFTMLPRSAMREAPDFTATRGHGGFTSNLPFPASGERERHKALHEGLAEKRIGLGLCQGCRTRASRHVDTDSRPNFPWKATATARPSAVAPLTASPPASSEHPVFPAKKARLIQRVLNRYLTAMFCCVTLFGPSTSQAEQVVVYSSRIEQLIKPMFDAFTKDTGIDVKFVTDKEGALLARLKAEGKNTPADMLITADAGNLWEAAREGLLKPIDSKTLESNIPAYLRDPQNQWFGLSVRARTIIFNPKKVNPADLSTYESLADPKWKGRLCLRTSKKVYNQSLVAMMIAEHGKEKTEEIVKGWVANLATDPLSDDTKAMEFVAAGKCDVTIVNTYYYGRLMEKNPALPLAIYWPNQENSGVHVNISGAGVTRYAKNAPGAVRLLEFLSSEKAQNLFADVNMEYSANPRISPDPVVAGWGTFKQNTINMATAGELQAEAVKLMDRAGYR